MAGYTKLFNSILASTIWRAPDKVRIVWITLLAMAGKNGVAEGSIPGLADMARVSIDDCKAALAELEAPDEYSRTKDHEGRRIQSVDGGWLILNHAKYREKMSLDERREYNRQKQAEGRLKKRVNAQSANVKNVKEGEHCQHNAEASPQSETEPKAYTNTDHDGFDRFWTAYPKKLGKGAARKAWDKAKCDRFTNRILDTLELCKSSEQWVKDGGQFIPHPATWLNREGWEDEPEPYVDPNDTPSLPDRTWELGPDGTEERFAKLRAEVDAMPDPPAR